MKLFNLAYLLVFLVGITGCVEQHTKKDTKAHKINLDQSTDRPVHTGNTVKKSTIWVGDKPPKYVSPIAKPYQSADNAGQTPAPKIFVSEPPPSGEYVFMDALLPGKLVAINNCVQIEATLIVSLEGAKIPTEYFDELVTPIWPDYVEVIYTGTDYILDLKGKLLSFGQSYNFGGGGVGQHINSSIRENCPDTKVWYVGEVESLRE